jgi:hypothetical protein
MKNHASLLALTLAFLFSLLPLAVVSAQGQGGGKDQNEARTKNAPNAPGQEPPFANLPKLNLPETISNLSGTISDYYLPLFVNEIERPLIPYVQVIAGICIGIICMFTFMQLGKESQGQAVDIAYQGIRFAVCYILIIWSPGLITNLFNLGYWLTNGSGQEVAVAVDGQIAPSTVGDNKSGGYLAGLRSRWRNDFNQNYRDFLHCGLYMKVGNDIQFSPAPGEVAVEEVIPFMQEPKDGNYIKQFFTRLNPKTWTPGELFSLVTACRGVMEVGLISTKILILFLIPALRITAPIFACLAVNKNLSSSISMNFVKGTLVATLVLPVVVTVLEITAYMIGNMAFGAFAGLDHEQYLVHTWDPNQMKIIQHGDPTWVALVGSILMAIAGLCIIISPFISFRMVSGSVFEGVTSAVSGWTGAGISSLVATVSAAAGAAIGRQADSAQNMGQLQASNRMALATRNAANAQASGQLQGAIIQNNYNVKAANERSKSENEYNQREANYARHDTNRNPITNAADSVADFGGRLIGVQNGAEKLRAYDRSNGVDASGGVAPTTTAHTKSVQDIQNRQTQGDFRAAADREEKLTNAAGGLANAQATAGGQFAAARITYAGSMEANQITFQAQESASQLHAAERVITAAGSAIGDAIGKQMETVNRV